MPAGGAVTVAASAGSAAPAAGGPAPAAGECGHSVEAAGGGKGGRIRLPHSGLPLSCLFSGRKERGEEGGVRRVR